MQGNVNGQASVLVSKGTEGRDAVRRMDTGVHGSDGWDDVEREREEIRKLKQQQKSTGDKRVTPERRTPRAVRRKRASQQEAVVAVRSGTKDGETYDVVSTTEKKHVVEEGTERLELRFARKRGRKIVKKLSVCEIEEKEGNPCDGAEVSSDVGTITIMKNNMDGKGIEVGDVVRCMDVEVMGAQKEGADGWDDVERERVEIGKLKQQKSTGDKRVTPECRPLREVRTKRALEQEVVVALPTIMGTKDGENDNVISVTRRMHVVEEGADKFWMAESILKEPRSANKWRRKNVKRSLCEIKEKEENLCDSDEGSSDVGTAAIMENNDDGEEVHWNVQLKGDAFHFRTAKTVSDGNRDTVFFDFDSYKSSLFVRKGEVWAMYDEHGMPRRYAKILENGFCNSADVRFLRFYNTDMRQWFKESGALRTCGSFIPCSLASSWASRCDATAFSHKLLRWEEEDRWVYEIYPSKGEIWAITTGSNTTPFHMGSPTIQKYHIVEVLEDYNVHTGTKVGYLAKVKGSYRSLFQRCLDEGDNLNFCIPPTDLERFSHQIPFFQIPEGRFHGCIELDPASLPLHIEGLTASLDHGIDETYLTMGLLDLKISWQQVEFRHDTVWAMYDNCTRMPQKYVIVQYIYKPNPESRLKISLLKPYHITEDERKWSDAGFPIGCGNFIVDEILDTNCHLVFSHPITFELEPESIVCGLHVYKIYPQKGDIWGIYKNLDVGGRYCQNGLRRKLQYEIVEIVRQHSSGKGTEARKLVRIEGFKFLFRRERGTFAVPSKELFRFSHQFPAYKFDAEQHGHFKGAIILDPMLVPETERHYFTFRDSSLLETFKLKPLHLVLHYLTGKGKCTVEDKEAKWQLSECLGSEVQNSDAKDGMDVGGAATWKPCALLQWKEERHITEEPSLCHTASGLSVTATPKHSLGKQVKRKTAQQEEQQMNVKSSTHFEKELMSNCCNLQYWKPEERTKKIDKPSLCQPSSSLSVPATPKSSLGKHVKRKAAQQEGPPVKVRSSTHIEEELMSNCCNLHCWKPDESMTKIEEPSLGHPFTSLSVIATPKPSLEKRKTVRQEGSPTNMRSSNHIEEELLSNIRNLRNSKQFRKSDRKEGMERGGTATRKPGEQLQCWKPEESKKKIEEPRLRHTSSSTSVSATPKPSLDKQVKQNMVRQEGQPLNVRCSTHIKVEPLSKCCKVNHEPNSRRTNEQRCLLARVDDYEEDEVEAISKAEKVQSELDPSLPSFVKLMKHSHVCGGFWLGLPAKFCRLHMPVHDQTFALIDENGKESKTVYLASKTGLSGGWRGFSIAHQLVPGDALVFQLAQPATFKVYIISANSSGASNWEQ